MKDYRELRKMMTNEQKGKADKAYKKYYEELFKDKVCWLAASMALEEKLGIAYGKIINDEDWE